MLPYLIVSHDYKRTSAGVRALHYLCHVLNREGCEAYVLANVTNEKWDTPQADTKAQRRIAAEGVVVYPEVEQGNRLQARRVVRYVLNRPGFIRGDVVFDSSERVFCYCEMLTKFVRASAHVLTVPVVDTELFRNQYLGRYGELFYVGKEKGISRVLHERSMQEITASWPESWEILARRFQTARVFYSYTDYTMLTVEARLCGCPAVVVPSGHYTREQFDTFLGGLYGLAWGPSLREIERAQITLGRFRRRYLDDIADFDRQLAQFVNITQEWNT